MSEEELLALTTSEGSGEAPRPDRPSRMDALKETLGRDLAFFAPTQGFGVRPEPQNIFARGETQAETEGESLLDRAKAGLAGLLDGFTPASSESTPTETPAPTASAAPAAPAPATTTTTPRARDNIPADQAVAAMSPSGPQTAADYLMEYGQAPEEKPRAGESAADRDARMRRLIAGLRGFGAQGLGGFAAGASEEQLRQEQEGIAEQERQRRAGMEDRELSLKDREVTLMGQIRQQQLDADIRQRAEQALLRLEALGSAEQQFVQEQIGERTANIDQLIQNMNLSLISGNVRGRDADALRNQILALQEQKANIIEEALINLQQPDRSAAIRAAEEAAYGSGGRGFNPDDFTVRQTSSQ